MFPTLTSCLRPPTFFLTINLTTVRNGMINLVRSHITENTFLHLPPQGAQPTHTHTNSFRSSHHCTNFSCTSDIRILILLRIKLDRKAKPGGYTGRKFYFPNDTPPIDQHSWRGTEILLGFCFILLGKRGKGERLAAIRKFALWIVGPTPDPKLPQLIVNDLLISRIFPAPNADDSNLK